MGSAFESTKRAEISVPSSRMTPRARPSRTFTFATGADGENFGAQFAACGSERLGDRAHAANHVAVEALNFAFAAAQQMKEQSQCGAGVVRAAVLAVDIVRQKHRLHFFGFVMAIEKIA